MHSPSPTPIPALLLTVFDSILEVFLLCLAGYILASKGILDKKTQKQINHLNVSLFTPALLFSKVAFFLSPAKLRELWVVPLFFVLVTVVSMSVAYCLGWMFGLKKSQTSFAMAAAMFMNSNSLPIALMQSLVVSVPHLKWGKDDNKNAMVGRALTYLVVYSTLGMILRWSYGVRLLSQADDEDEVSQSERYDPEPTTVLSAPVTERTPLLTNHAHYASTSTSTFVSEPEDMEYPTSTHHRHLHTAGGDKGNDDDGDNGNENTAHGVSSSMSTSTLLRPPPPVKRQTTYYKSFPNSPTQEERAFLPSSESSSDLDSTPSAFASPSESDIEAGEDDHQVHDDDDDGEEGVTATATASGSPVLPLHTSQIPKQSKSKLKSKLQASNRSTSRPKPKRKSTTTTATLSITQRYYRTTRRAVSRYWHSLNNFMTVPLWAALASIVVACVRPLQHVLDDHLLSVKGALGAAGNCSIPLTLVVLGAYFYTPARATGGGGGEANGGVSVGVNRSKSAETLVGGVKGFLGMKSKRASGVSVVGEEVYSSRRQQEEEEEANQQKKMAEARKTRGETKTVAIAVLSRMIITPLVLLPLVALSAKYDWQKVFEDPVFVVANVLLMSSPPALTLAQITQAASGDAFERLISRTIFWSYCVLTPPTTIFYVVVGLLLAKLE